MEALVRSALHDFLRDANLLPLEAPERPLETVAALPPWLPRPASPSPEAAHPDDTRVNPPEFRSDEPPNHSSPPATPSPADASTPPSPAPTTPRDDGTASPQQQQEEPPSRLLRAQQVFQRYRFAADQSANAAAATNAAGLSYVALGACWSTFLANAYMARRPRCLHRWRPRPNAPGLSVASPAPSAPPPVVPSSPPVRSEAVCLGTGATITGGDGSDPATPPRPVAKLLQVRVSPRVLFLPRSRLTRLAGYPFARLCRPG